MLGQTHLTLCVVLAVFRLRMWFQLAKKARVYDGTAWQELASAQTDLTAYSTTAQMNTAIAAAGKILQVVRSSTATEITTSSTTYIDTSLTATITPKSASSRILVFITQNGVQKSNGHPDNAVQLRLVLPNTTTEIFANLLMLTNTSTRLIQSTSYTSIYSPGSTSAQTFKTQFANFTAAASVSVQMYGGPSTMVLMEVGA